MIRSFATRLRVSRERNAGQATTEYMLVLSVLVIAMVYVFWDGLVTPFNTAMEDIGDSAKTVYASGDLAE